MHQEIWFQKYKILGLLGKGGTSTVYLAVHIKLNSYRAIKFISKNHPLYNFQRKEAFVLKNLKHSCIPIIYDIEEDEEGSYIIEQYLEGQTLKEYVDSQGLLSEDIIIQYGIQICNLIQYLHSTLRPILYIDLKPDNIILSDHTIKLIDFGSALYQDELSEAQPYTGTRGYSAPELYHRTKIDERSDVYSIGMLLYFMATKIMITRNSLDFDNIDQVSSCSMQLKNIINKCLKFHPSLRYASVSNLYAQLSALSKKNQYNGSTKKKITFAIAGAQPRIGVTHFSFRLCNYLLSRKLNCIYLERNNSGGVRIMKSRYEGAAKAPSIYTIGRIPLLLYQEDRSKEEVEAPLVIIDYGCLTGKNVEEFLQADVKLLLLGLKDWELNYSEEALDLVAEYKEIYYLFNFANGQQFSRAVQNMEHRKCYRVPYEPDPFSKITAQNGKELFHELYNQSKGLNLQ